MASEVLQRDSRPKISHTRSGRRAPRTGLAGPQMKGCGGRGKAQSSAQRNEVQFRPSIIWGAYSRRDHSWDASVLICKMILVYLLVPELSLHGELTVFFLLLFD